jgi:pyrrolidone-carboxylate peptidase
MSNFKSEGEQKEGYIHIRIHEKVKAAFKKAIKKMGKTKQSKVIMAAIELIIRDPSFRDRVKEHLDYQ